MKKYLFVIALAIISNITFAQRKVLIEEFTNSGCPSCASAIPTLTQFVNANLNNVLMLAYHAPFPYNDSMYYENALQNDAQISYYSIPYVPYSIIDGNYYSNGTSILNQNLSATVNARVSVAPRYNISISNATLNANILTASVTAQSIDAMNQSENLILKIVVSEQSVLKSAYLASPGNNSETVYPWVVRRMLPDENGTTLLNTSINGIDNVNQTWQIQNIKDVNELRIIAFVQNALTKEIYQSEMTGVANVTNAEEVNADAFMFTSFPTIANEKISILFKESYTIEQIKILDVFGKEVYSLQKKDFKNLIEIDLTPFSSGVYFISARVGNAVVQKKFIKQ